MEKLFELLRLKAEFYDKESEKVRKSSLRKYEMYAAKRAECDELIYLINHNLLDDRINLLKNE